MYETREFSQLLKTLRVRRAGLCYILVFRYNIGDSSRLVHSNCYLGVLYTVITPPQPHQDM